MTAYARVFRAERHPFCGCSFYLICLGQHQYALPLISRVSASAVGSACWVRRDHPPLTSPAGSSSCPSFVEDDGGQQLSGAAIRSYVLKDRAALAHSYRQRTPSEFATFPIKLAAREMEKATGELPGVFCSFRAVLMLVTGGEHQAAGPESRPGVVLCPVRRGWAVSGRRHTAPQPATRTSCVTGRLSTALPATQPPAANGLAALRAGIGSWRQEREAATLASSYFMGMKLVFDNAFCIHCLIFICPAVDR